VSRPATGRGPTGRVLVLVVGDEVLDGSVRDRNGSRIAAEVKARGGNVTRLLAVGDDPASIAAAVTEGLREGGVIVSGGIGPTGDDVTREAVAAALERELETEAGWAGRLTSRFPAAARLPGMERQSRIPRGARPVDNPSGTALGFAAETPDGGWVLVLPGVPGEVEAMLSEAAGAFLDERLSSVAGPVVRVATAGVPESVVAARIEGLPELRGLRVASYPHRGTVDLLLRPPADEGHSEAGLRRLEAAAAALRGLFGADVFEVGRRGLAEVVLEELRRRGATLSVAESCTGGGLGREITSVPGSSDVFWGGVIAYANEAKRGLLGVPDPVLEGEGAVSEAAARAMARGMRDRSGTDWAIAITGIAGPGGGTLEKPVGTVWIAVNGEREAVRGYRLPGSRDDVRRRSIAAALDLLRRLVLFPE